MNITLLEAKAPQVGRPVVTNLAERLVQMTVEGTGTVSATAYVEVSNDRIKWFKACLDMTVTGIASAEAPLSDNWPSFSAAWAFMRAVVTDVQGTDAKVTLTLGLV